MKVTLELLLFMIVIFVCIFASLVFLAMHSIPILFLGLVGYMVYSHNKERKWHK